jgi:peroxiredoxin
MIDVTSRLNEELAEIHRGNALPPEVTEVIANSILEGSRGAVKGLAIGQPAPDFTLVNQNGATVQLAERLARGPAVVGFFRGEWCPFCTMELRALRRFWPDFAARSASMILIHPQHDDVSQKVAVPPDAGFDVCSDPEQRVMAAFDVRFALDPGIRDLYQNVFGLDLERLNASGQWNLPVPATFIIDRDGIIKGRQFSHDFTVRVEPTYIVEVLDRLPEPSPELVVVRKR